MTLKEALETIAEYCRRHDDCGDCTFHATTKNAERHWCKLGTEMPEDYDKIEVEG